MNRCLLCDTPSSIIVAGVCGNCLVNIKAEAAAKQSVKLKQDEKVIKKPLK